MGEPSGDGGLPDPGQAGALYQLGTAAWQAIAQRISAVIAAQQIAAEITPYIPNYPALVSVCTTWRDETSVAVASQSILVELFASGVAKQFGTILTGLAGQDDAAPVPASSVFMDTVQFQALADQAGQFAAKIIAQAPQVARFVAENEAADASLARIAQNLPSDWTQIAGPLTTLGSAFPAVGDAWSDIAARLQATADRKLTLTTVGTLRNELTATIAAWNQLGTNAQAFSQQAGSSGGQQ